MNTNEEVPAQHHTLHNHVHPLSLEFEDVEYVVGMRQEKRWWCSRTTTTTATATATTRRRSQGKDKQILKGLTGKAYPGEMLAMLGPSGSGKTTLLTALSGRRLSGKLSGVITYNGGPFSGKIRRQTGLVSQEDALYAHLTVTETLFYTALLRLPTTLTREEKAAQVERVVAELGLGGCRDSLVGGRQVRGISGGERKRVSIGQEMLINPSLLLLDEPTSGLDSTAALRLLWTLRKLACSGRTVVATIHQPSSRLYSCFDKVLLLCEGSPIYYGPANAATHYFHSLGFFSSNVSVNPADFLLDLAHGIDSSESQACEKNESSSGEDEKERKKTLILAFREKIEIPLKQKHDEEEACCVPLGDRTRDDEKSRRKCKEGGGGKWSTSWGHQFMVLMERGVKERRFEALDKLRVFQVMSVAFLGGLIWWRVPFSHLQDRVAMISFFSLFWSFYPLYNAVFTFPPERRMLEKETSSGMYRLSSYFMARNIGEAPLEMALPVVFVVVVYWMGGLKPSLGCFVLTLLVLLLNVLVAQSLGMAIGAYLIGNLKQATTLASVISIVFIIAGGFYAQHIPPAIVWIKYMSYSYYCFRLLLGVQYGREEEMYVCGRGVVCRVADFPTIESMGGLRHHPWVDVGIMLLMLLSYRLLAYLSLRWTLASSS